MTGKSSKNASDLVRYRIEDLPSAPPLSRALKDLSDSEVDQRAAMDADAGFIPEDFWDNARIVEPEGTEQITLRLPRRVLRHFKATGKGYQSRISAVLASYVDARKKAG